jgi:segregation and condensation protein A
VLIGIGLDQFAALAVRALTPREPVAVAVDHVHQVRVSVREQAILLAQRLAEAGTASFRALVADCRETVEVVARFLALLELYREGHVTFEQIVPLGDLQCRWTGHEAAASGYLSVEEYDGTDDPAPEEPADG